MNDIQKKLDDLVSQSDYFVASPDTIEGMRKKGLPIKSTLTTYQDYLDKLFLKKRDKSKELINKLPHMDDKIANATVQSLYDELRECFVLGIPGASITLSIILLELALKYRLYEERIKENSKASWNSIEKLDFKETINILHEKMVITLNEKNKLHKFNSKIRNNYIHYNIKKIIRGLIIKELPSVNIETGEVTINHNIEATKYPFLWFSAKKVLDNKSMTSIVTFSISWVNKLLVRQ